MTHTVDRRLAGYDYRLPVARVALTPAAPRDSANVLVCSSNGRPLTIDTFRRLDRNLPPRSVLVFNRTKVVPARLTLRRQSGGRVQLLYLSQTGNVMRAMADRRLRPGERLRFSGRWYWRVVRHSGKYFDLRCLFPVRQLDRLLERYGSVPIPPYLKRTPLRNAELKKKYQTTFAEVSGSVAAPTASLHFTRRLFARLRAAGHQIEFVTLHVNLGTFAPLTDTQLRTRRLHSEAYSVDPGTAVRLNLARRSGRPIIAVGTTVARTLESAADARGRLRSRSGTTDLFIRPGYRWRIVDGLITNFHVPRSSLLMLVASLVGRENVMALYDYAQRRRMRFWSFGDGMLILPRLSRALRRASIHRPRELTKKRV